MIAVVANHLIEEDGRELSIYRRILKNLEVDSDKFELHKSLDDVPAGTKTVILLDDWDSQLTKTALGRYIPIHKARGYRFSVGNRIYIPTYSPNILNGRPDYIPVVIQDFEKAEKMDGQPPPLFPIDDLILNPTPPEFKYLCHQSAASEFVVVDLETTGKDKDDADEAEDQPTTITRASIAYQNEYGHITGITLPWIEPYISTFVDLMDTEVPKVFWNGFLFDLLVLEENLIPVRGRLYDAMWLHHFFEPTYPKSLGSVTSLVVDVPEWKSLANKEPELYSAMDAWAEAKCFLEIRDLLKKRGTWELAERHVTDILAILDAMSKKGILVDQEALDAFNAECDKQLAELQEKFNNHPDLLALRPYHPKHKDGTVGYKKTPKDTTGMVALDNGRWAKQEDFLANSHQQVAAYLKSKDYEYKGTTDEKTLSQLARRHKDQLLRDFIKYREVRKLRSTYGGFPIGEDGRVHTTFTLRPDTHRLSSIKPNCQNIPPEFKHIFKASPGHKLIEADLSSVEAVLTGYFAQDKEYIRRAKIGIHKIAMATFLGIEVDFNLSDAEIKKLVDPVKDRDPKLYRQIKTVIYGGNYLAGARTIYHNNPEEFSNEAEAKKFLEFCQKLSPKIPEWQRTTIKQARAKHRLRNPFRYHKSFWDVGSGPAMCAFLPQSTTAAIMKEIMLGLWGEEAGRYMVLQVHDSLVFDVPEDRVDAVRRQIHNAFTRPWPELDGMQIGYEVKVGDSLKL